MASGNKHVIVFRDGILESVYSTDANAIFKIYDVDTDHICGKQLDNLKEELKKEIAGMALASVIHDCAAKYEEE